MWSPLRDHHSADLEFLSDNASALSEARSKPGALLLFRPRLARSGVVPDRVWFLQRVNEAPLSPVRSFLCSNVSPGFSPE